MHRLGRTSPALVAGASQPAELVALDTRGIDGDSIDQDTQNAIYTLTLSARLPASSQVAVGFTITQILGDGVTLTRTVYMGASAYRRQLQVAGASIVVTAQLYSGFGTVAPSGQAGASNCFATAALSPGWYDGRSSYFPMWIPVEATALSSDSPWVGCGTMLMGTGNLISMGAETAVYFWPLDTGNLALSFDVTAGGTYTTVPTITPTGGGSGSGFKAGTFTAVMGLSDPSVTTPGTGYALSATIPVTLPAPSIAGGTQATGHVTTSGAGALATFVIDTPGSGYTAGLSAFGVPGGTGTVSCELEIVNVTTTGSGYTQAPTLAVSGAGEGSVTASITNAAGGAVQPITGPMMLTAVGNFNYDNTSCPAADFMVGFSWGLSSSGTVYTPISDAAAEFEPLIGV